MPAFTTCTPGTSLLCWTTVGLGELCMDHISNIIARLCLVLLFEIVYSMNVVIRSCEFYHKAMTPPVTLRIYTMHTLHRPNPTHGLEHMVYTRHVSTVMITGVYS